MAPNSVQTTRQIICKLMSRCTKLRDWRSLVLEGVSSLSTIFNCIERRTAPFPRSRRWNICQIPCKLSRQISCKLTRYEFQFVFQQFHDARRVLLLHLL